MPLDHTSPLEAIPVESLGIDRFEAGLLSVLRHFMTSFAKPESQAWQHAHAVACERWGVVRGPQIAHALLAVIQTLRQERRREFRFTNPLCLECRKLCTKDEAAFCRMLHAMRRDRTDLAREALPDLTDGKVNAPLVQSALSFAARFPASYEAEAERGDRMEPARATHSAAAHLRLVH